MHAAIQVAYCHYMQLIPLWNVCGMLNFDTFYLKQEDKSILQENMQHLVMTS